MNKMWRKLNANIQHCSLSAVQRKTAFVEQSWCPEFDMFGSMPWCSFPWHKLLAGAKELLYNSLNLFHEFTSLFSLKVIFAGLLRKAFPQKHAFVDISVFLWFRKQQPRFVQGQPKAQFAEFNVPTCGKIAVWQLSRERQPLWNSHDGLNLTCLDQYHGVRSHGTSSWLESEFDPWVYNIAKVIFTGLRRKAFPRKAFPRKQAFVDISVFLCLRKQQPRFAQGQPEGYFQMKEFDRTTEAFVPTNERWRKLNANMRQYVPLSVKMGQHCSLWAVQRKAAFVEQSWWPETTTNHMHCCNFGMFSGS